jgi:hypothetical protein
MNEWCLASAEFLEQLETVMKFLYNLNTTGNQTYTEQQEEHARRTDV